MAGSASNVATGSGSTGSTRRKPKRRVTVARPRGGTPAAPAPANGSGGFVWNGRGGHSKSFASHLAALATKRDDRNPLYDPSQQLSGSALRQAAEDLTSADFNPQEQALRQSLSDATNQSTALAGRAAAYSNQLGAVDAGIIPQQQGIQGKLSSSIDANAGTANTAIQSLLQQQRDQASADAQLRGGGPASTAAGAEQEAAAQQGRVAEQQQVAQTNAAAEGANWQSLANLAGTARRQAGEETQRDLLTQLANAQTGIRNQLTDLGKNRGAETAKNLTNLRQQSYENLITQAGLNIKSDQIRADQKIATAKIKADATQGSLDRQSRERIARDNRAARAAADREARTGKANSINPYGYTNAQWLALSVKDRQHVIDDFTKRQTADKALSKPGAKPGEQPTAAAQTQVTQITNGVSDVLNDPKLKRHRFETGPRLTQILVKRGMPPLQAQAAAELARYGYLQPQTQTLLERAGISVPANWRRATATQFPGPH